MKRLDLKTLMDVLLSDIRVELTEEFDKNFERQGFFTEAWQRRVGPLRPGGATLVDSGTLRRSFRCEVRGGELVFVYGAPYAAYHNEGATVRVTEKMKMYFRHRYYELAGGGMSRGGSSSGSARRRLTDAGFYALMEKRGGSAEAKFWGYMSLKKVGSVIKIPMRRFLGRSAEVERIVREVIDDVLDELMSDVFSNNDKR